jgi:peptidoglycan/xylan/chitin deacetylase (PgdA/CDA1 family)
MLDQLNLKATFFILGWVGTHHPNLVKEIKSRGHEIGAHSYWHHNVNLLKPEDFEKDLILCLNQLQEITGDKVTSYRAPGYSLRIKDQWAFEILATHGIQIDSSVDMIDNGIAPPMVIKTNNSSIIEFPMLRTSYGLPYTGGGYFRLLPSSIIRYLFKGDNYRLLYFHPRDFATNKPYFNMFSVFRNWLDSYNTSECKAKLMPILREKPTLTLGQAAAAFKTNNSKSLV